LVNGASTVGDSSGVRSELADQVTETFAQPVSAVQERIWREVLGDEYPEGLDIYSFVTVSEFDRICDAV
jgi:hypothetical protein